MYTGDGTSGQMEGIGLIKGGPNPEQAKAFVDFVNRKDVRELILTGTFRRPVRQDLDLANLPGAMPPLPAIKMLSYREEAWTAVRSKTLEQVKDIVQATR